MDEPIPSCLPCPKWMNRDVPPQKWGMRAAQFNDVVASFAETRAWSRWIQEKGYANLYDTNSLVKTWTRGTGCSIALRMNPEMNLEAELMISHSWAEDVEECREAVDQFMMKHGNLDKTVVIWFCAFANYQPGDEPGDVGPTIAEQLNRDPFGCVIQVTCTHQGMLVVHTSTAEVYRRLWCVYEIDAALRTKSQISVCFSNKYISDRGGRSLLDLLRARTIDAKCGEPSDEDMIRTEIINHGGFKALDLKIFEFRLTSLEDLMLQADNTLQQELQDELKLAEKVLASGTLHTLHDVKRVWTPKRVILLITLACSLAAIGLAAGLITASNTGVAEHGPGTPEGPDSPTGSTPPDPGRGRCEEYWLRNCYLGRLSSCGSLICIEADNVTRRICGFHITRLAVPLSPGMCKDNATFRDVQGSTCTNWTSVSCWSADGRGYTLDEASSVLQGCPRSCGLCNCSDGGGGFGFSPAPAPAPAPGTGSDLMDAGCGGAECGGGDLTYVILCVCAAVIGLCIAGFICLLVRRWHGGASTSDNSPSQSDLEQKEEMQDRLAKLKALMQDRPDEDSLFSI